MQASLHNIKSTAKNIIFRRGLGFELTWRWSNDTDFSTESISKNILAISSLKCIKLEMICLQMNWCCRFFMRCFGFGCSKNIFFVFLKYATLIFGPMIGKCLTFVLSYSVDENKCACVCEGATMLGGQDEGQWRGTAQLLFIPGTLQLWKSVLHPCLPIFRHMFRLHTHTHTPALPLVIGLCLA